MDKEREYIKVFYYHAGIERSMDLMLKEKHFITTIARDADNEEVRIKILKCSQRQWESKFV